MERHGYSAKDGIYHNNPIEAGFVEWITNGCIVAQGIIAV